MKTRNIRLKYGTFAKDGEDGAGGGGTGNWRDSLPDDLKGNESLANFEDVGSLAKSFIEAKSYQGSSIRIPGEDAGTEDITAFNQKLLEKVPTLMQKPNFENPEQTTEFYRSLGMPEKSDGYSLPEIDVPDGVNLNQDRLGTFKEIAHKNGLSVTQFNNVMAEVMQADIAAAQANNQALADGIKTVKEKWGHAYDENMNKVNLMLDKTEAPDQLREAVKTGAIGPEALQWLYSMGKQMGGEGFDFKDDIDAGGKPPAMTPEEARNAIAEINNNPNHAYWAGNGQEKQDAIARMIELQKYANPTAAVEIARAGEVLS